MSRMKIWLDDIRPAPEGWYHCNLLESNVILEISLDHDLGDDEKGTGYDVLLWLEEQLFHGYFNSDHIPTIHIHTANPIARKRMEESKKKIEWYKYNNS